MRNVAAATALALGLGLASNAHAQSSPPNQPSLPAPQPASLPSLQPAEQTPLAAGAASEEAGSEEAGSEHIARDDEADLAMADETSAATGDPLEDFNREIYKFNDAIDQVAVEPLARGYRTLTPHQFRDGIRNFLHNLKSPVILANDILQGEPGRAGATIGRFAINTTVGMLGFVDVATPAGIKGHDEDFGQTLGKWGIGPGPYLMLPLLGPSNLRDGVGRVVDIAIDPITYADFKHDDTTRAVRTGADLLTQRTDALEAVDSIRQTALDPYVSTRSAYDQARESAISNGQDLAEDSPDSE